MIPTSVIGRVLMGILKITLQKIVTRQKPLNDVTIQALRFLRVVNKYYQVEMHDSITHIASYLRTTIPILKLNSDGL